jgi:Smr domain/Domain of unknown function (DUF2027)
MNIGDKVRLLRGKEEGVITRFLHGNIVEIEIEEGFCIPAQRSEVVVVAEAEAAYLRMQQGPVSIHQTSKQKVAEGPIANAGLYMVFVPLNDREVTQYVVNNTDWSISFVLYQGAEPHFQGLKAATLPPRSTEKIQNLLSKEFETWGIFSFQALYLRPAFLAERLPLVKKLRIKAESYYKSKQKAPLLEKDAFVFQLDDVNTAKPISPQALAEKMMTSSATVAKSELPVKPSSSVDLHIEKLSRNSLAMSNRQMLDLQISTFEQQLEAAIVNGLDYITFIHGIGNGILRDELHKRLSKHKNVKFFEDAQKEKFGYGATKVAIK